MTGPELIGIFGGMAAAGLATYVGLVVRPLEKELEATEKQRKLDRDADAKAIDKLTDDFDKRLDALHTDKRELEKRMNEIEKNALHRSELDAMRRDMESAVERMGDRVMKHFDDTAARLEKRIEHVEATHG